MATSVQVVLVVTQSSPEDYELFERIEDSVAQSRAKVSDLVLYLVGFAMVGE